LDRADIGSLNTLQADLSLSARRPLVETTNL